MKRGGFTLIEELIVIAILAILSGTTLVFFLTAFRANQGARRQGQVARELTVAERAWRSDVQEAVEFPAAAGMFSATSETLILRRNDGAATATTVIVYQVRPVETPNISAAPAGTGATVLRLERLRLAPDGSTLSRQELVSSADRVEFGSADAPGLRTLTLAASGGFEAYRSTQRFKALAHARRLK